MTLETDVHSESGAAGMAPKPIPTRKTPVIAVAAISPHPNSSITPISAEDEADDANVRERVRKLRRKTTHALYSELQF